MTNPLKGAKVGTYLLGLLGVAVLGVVIGYSMEKGKKWAD